MSYFRTNGVGVGSSNFSASSLYFKLKTAKKKYSLCAKAKQRPCTPRIVLKYSTFVVHGAVRKQFKLKENIVNIN